MTDHNEQYLRGMGVDPGTLGKPYEGVSLQSLRDNALRCMSRNPETDNRCIFRRDHEGIHIRGKERWGDESVPPSEPFQFDRETLVQIASDLLFDQVNSGAITVAPSFSMADLAGEIVDALIEDLREQLS